MTIPFAAAMTTAALTTHEEALDFLIYAQT